MSKAKQSDPLEHMQANYMDVDFRDKDGNLEHNAIITAVEAAIHFKGRPFNIIGFVLDDEANKMTNIDRGLAMLDDADYCPEASLRRLRPI